jgi:alpha-soluble NSF attachment protein
MHQKAAQIFVQVQDSYEACAAYENAAKSFESVDSQLATLMFQERINILLDEGQLAMAARSEREIGEMLEKEQKFDQAIKHYETAQVYFGTSSTNGSNVLACQSSIAHLLTAIEPPRYTAAAEVFEVMGKNAATADTARTSSAKEYFSKAALCRLAAGDLVGAKRSLVLYASDFVEWKSTREFLFLGLMVHAIENYDLDHFSAVVEDWNAASTLDSWRNSIILKIREGIRAADETNLP